MIESLWPVDLKLGTIKAPVTILREQATELGKLTNNILEGYVELSRLSSNTTVRYTFYIVAPAIGGYRYELFTISHAVANMYPVSVGAGADDEESCDDEAAFRAKLKKMFSSANTGSIITSLLAQSQG